MMFVFKCRKIIKNVPIIYQKLELIKTNNLKAEALGYFD